MQTTGARMGASEETLPDVGSARQGGGKSQLCEITAVRDNPLAIHPAFLTRRWADVKLVFLPAILVE